MKLVPSELTSGILVCCRGFDPRSSGLQPDAMTTLANNTKYLEPLDGIEPSHPEYKTGTPPFVF